MVSSTHPRVGFVGVGKLGRPMAQRLMQFGFDLIIFDTDDSATSQFKGTSVSVAKSLDELALECEIICLCLPGPGEMKKARVVLRKPPSKDKERYYRVTFKATIPEPLRLKEMGLTKDELAEQDALSANISMISGMGIFLTVAPQEIKPKLTWTRDANGITFVNEGNTSIELRTRKEYCFDGNKNDCISLPYKRIYPGKSWTFEIGGDKPIVYYYKVYDNTEKAIIGAVK